MEIKAKNKSVQRLVDAAKEFEAAIDGLFEDFQGRYDGDYHWRAATGTKPVLQKAIKQILMATGQAIPEDRLFAYRAAGSDEKDHGRATTFSRIKTDKSVKIEHCADCPGNQVVKKSESNMRTFVKSTKVEPTAKEKAAPKVKEEKVESNEEVFTPPVVEKPEVKQEILFPDVEAVLKSFDNDVDMMKAYCEKEGIEIGRRSKAESIAECIVEFHAE